jgi:nitroimidazol reductase NimA-like FMN-containing flavoprotein (pyridoxamine 5'-phosphate oxidase superfamily)
VRSGEVAGTEKLSAVECIDLIGSVGVGRAAICGPTGPQIFPVNYVVDGESIVFRTSAFSALGTLSPGANVAFEVDSLDATHGRGWSVVATGQAEAINDEAELNAIRERGLEPAPWATGLRRSYIRLQWVDISGRVVGHD